MNGLIQMNVHVMKFLLLIAEISYWILLILEASRAGIGQNSYNRMLKTNREMLKSIKIILKAKSRHMRYSIFI
jgi:hypothetical protein